jgi:PPR repeat
VHAARLFEEMKAAGVQPDVVTYNSLINAYARCGRVAEVSACSALNCTLKYCKHIALQHPLLLQCCGVIRSAVLQ